MQARAAQRRVNRAWFRIAGGVLLAVASVVTLLLIHHVSDDRPVFSHMRMHVVLMNAIAPLIAISVVQLQHTRAWLGTAWVPGLVWATACQIMLLWGWHAPPNFEVVSQSLIASSAMHVSLLGAALFFWLRIFEREGATRWQSIGALLITGKLFCLLGAVLIFSPRPLYDLSVFGRSADIADQQLAGLLMVVACPLTYVLAGVMIAARWLVDLEHSFENVPVTQAEG